MEKPRSRRTRIDLVTTKRRLNPLTSSKSPGQRLTDHTAKVCYAETSYKKIGIPSGTRPSLSPQTQPKSARHQYKNPKKGQSLKKITHKKTLSNPLVLFHNTKRSRSKGKTKKSRFEAESLQSSDSETERKAGSTLETGSSFDIPFSEDREQLLARITSSVQKTGQVPPTSLDFYRVGKQLGTGSFGKVSLGLHKLTGFKVALKSIDKVHMKDERIRQKVQQEVFVMNRVFHPNVTRVLEVFETDSQLMIVLEYVGGCDLLHLLKMRKFFPEAEAKLIFRQLIAAVKACHLKNVAHRDIKLDNVLVTPDFKQIKLCDFGVSRMIMPGEKVQEQCGTPAYLAPEVVADRWYEPRFVDLWSMGILLYALVCGTVPFKAKTMPDLHKTILKGKFDFPEHLSKDLKELIVQILNPIPTLRPTLDEMSNHPWFDKLEAVTGSNRFVGVDLPQEYDRENQYQLLEELKQFGFPQESIIQNLRFKDMNHATATFHLLSLYKNTSFA